MGWYVEQVVPRITNRVANTETLRRIRRRVCAKARGDVLELGFGSGLNLPHLPSEVTGLWTVEPSRVALRLAEERLRSTRLPVREAGLDGQHLDLPDERFDTVLSTFTLCTIPDPSLALREVRRVLRPGGQFLFAEHGLAPDPSVVTWQRRLEPLQKRAAGGCHLTRPIDELVESSGMRIHSLRAEYVPKEPRPLGYVYEGVAHRD